MTNILSSVILRLGVFFVYIWFRVQADNFGGVVQGPNSCQGIYDRLAIPKYSSPKARIVGKNSVNKRFKNRGIQEFWSEWGIIDPVRIMNVRWGKGEDYLVKRKHVSPKQLNASPTGETWSSFPRCFLLYDSDYQRQTHTEVLLFAVSKNLRDNTIFCGFDFIPPPMRTFWMCQMLRKLITHYTPALTYATDQITTLRPHYI